MSENPYQAPLSETLSAGDQQESAGFYVVSTRKFLALYFATLGTYAFYWNYRNWMEYRKRTGEQVLPVMRGLFHIFFLHGLFQRVHDRLGQNSLQFSWSPRGHATALVFAILVSNTLDRLAYRSIGSPYTDYVSLAMLVPLAGLFLKAQHAINAACGDPRGGGNDEFTPANWAWILLGAALWILNLYGISKV